MAASNLRAIVVVSNTHQLENVAIIAIYCHLRPPDTIAFPT